MPNKIYGYEIREPYLSELSFFKGRPEVAGMATEDNKIILNPYSSLNDREKQAVLKIEAARLWMKENKIGLDFELTPEQIGKFKNTEYGQNPTALKESIISRIIVGDPSVGTTTSQQKYWANLINSGLIKNGNLKTNGKEAKMGLFDGILNLFSGLGGSSLTPYNFGEEWQPGMPEVENVPRTLPNVSGGGGFGNLFSSANLNKALPLALTGLSMLGGNKQAEVKWSQPPATPQSQAITQQAMDMGAQGWSSPETLKQIYNQMANLNVSRGLAPDASSGAFNQSMADALTRLQQQEYASKLNALQVARSGIPPAQMTVQQPTPNWLQTGASTYLDLVNKANLMRALGGNNFQYSALPWA